MIIINLNKIDIQKNLENRPNIDFMAFKIYYRNIPRYRMYK